MALPTRRKKSKKTRRPVEPEEEEPEEEDPEDEDADSDPPSAATEAFGPSDVDDVDDSLFPDDGDAAEADGIWADGIDETDRGKPVGDWIGEIISAELCRSAGSGRLQIKYQIEVMSGESTGVKVWKYDGLGSAQQASITQGQLQRIGINPKQYTTKTLPAALVPITGIRVAVNARVNGDFYNIFFQRVVTEDVIDKGRERDKSRTRRPSTTQQPSHKTGRRRL